MNEDLNDHPGREIAGSPQLRLYFKGRGIDKEEGKSFVDYKNKQFGVENIKQWLIVSLGNYNKEKDQMER